MPIQPVNVGQAPDDGTGDPYRTAMQKLNSNIQILDNEKANTADVAVELGKKVDKVTGKDLSDENYTLAEKQKLAGLESSRYRGLFADLPALQAALPAARPGDYADVDMGAGTEVARYIWDDSDSAWVQQGAPATPLTAAQVKELYESNPDTNAFSDDEKSKLGGVEVGATANETDSFLLARANHTGTQAISTVEGLNTWLTNLAARQLAFGDGQTRKTVSKTTGMTYTNTSGRTIEVGIIGVTKTNPSYVAVSVAGKFRSASWTPQSGSTVAASAFVLPGETYVFAGGPQGTPPTMEFWEVS